MVAGVALLIQNAMGGMQAWQYTLNDVLTVKDILLATASETAPNLRDNDPTHSPILTRGGKDIQEGYGMLNPLTALQLTTNLQSGNYSNTQCLFAPNDTLANLAENSINSYDFAVNYSMSKQYYYNLELTMDPTIDADLYVYSPATTTYGEPVLLYESINATLGQTEEILNLNSSKYSNLFIVVKAIAGHGNVTLNIAAILEITPPFNPQMYSPSAYSFQNAHITITSNAQDAHTMIYYCALIMTHIGSLGLPVAPYNQTIEVLPYNLTTVWNVSSIEDGWYDAFLRFYNGNNITVDSQSIQIAVDVHPPAYLHIVLPLREPVYGEQ